MQMSRERFQAVHNLIWSAVIAHATDIENKRASVWFLKMVGAEAAYDKGLLDYVELELIKHNNSCLLCAMSKNCETCLLGDCEYEDSLYKRACHGDKNAMIEIRDVVDKPPFTELSVITLYYH